MTATNLTQKILFEKYLCELFKLQIPCYFLTECICKDFLLFRVTSALMDILGIKNQYLHQHHYQ